MADTHLVSTILELVRRIGRVPQFVPVTHESRMVDELNIDSLDLVNLFLTIQDQFEVEIDDNDLPRLATPGDICRYVKQRQEVASA